MAAKSKSRIFLVGPMGAGKTSVGKSLALVLELPFIDVDEEIVRTQCRSIPEIFSEDGESGFRKIETEVLKKLCAYEAVISTGGGVVVTPENLQILSHSGTVVFLYADVETQFKRTCHDKNRPLIQVEDPKLRLKQLFDVRRPLYEKVSDITVDTCSLSVHGCVEHIRSSLAKV